MMNVKWSITVITLLGIAAAFCAALLVASLRAGQEQTAKPTASNQISIVVAARALAEMTVLDAQDVQRIIIDKDQAPNGCFRNPVQVIGKVLSTPMVKGEALTQACLAGLGPGVRLSTDLPPGMRAVSVEPAGHSGLRGLLYPGCIVDVLGTFQMGPDNHKRGRAVSTTLLQGVKVLAVEDRTVFSGQAGSKQLEDRNRPRKNPMVTLMVDSNQAKVLQLAVQHGTVSLALRNPTDQTVAQIDPTLLKGGQLARLADILEAESRKAKLAGPTLRRPSSKPSDSPSTLPVTTIDEITTLPPSVWETTIIRGVEYEVRSFPMPTENETPQGVVEDRDQSETADRNRVKTHERGD